MKEKCPRCNNNDLHPTQVFNSLSRTTRTADTKAVYVCNPCGTDEALQQHDLEGYCTPQSEWPIEEHMFKHMIEMFQRSHDRYITELMESEFDEA
jgi:hypothetical protein